MPTIEDRVGVALEGGAVGRPSGVAEAVAVSMRVAVAVVVAVAVAASVLRAAVVQLALVAVAGGRRRRPKNRSLS